MPISFSPLQMREIIMEHYQYPRNIEDKSQDKDYITVHMDSASCIDDIYVSVKIVEDKIVDCKWHYSDCCSISRASTSIMSELVIGKTIEEAKDIMDNFNNMLNEKDYDSDLLEEACCFKNTSAQPSRIGCATIGWRGFWNAVLEIQNGKR